MKNTFTICLLLLLRLNYAQNWAWAQSGNNPGGTAEGLGIARDKNNNSFITGYFESVPCSFGTNTLNSTGSSNVYVVKYSPGGSVLWAKASSGPYAQEGRSVCTDTSGNCYVTGLFNGANIVFDSYTLTNSGSNNQYLVKFSPNGNALWATSSTASNACIGQNVTCDRNNNIFVTGWFLGNTVMGTSTMVATCTVNVFVAKYDQNGNVLWTKSSAGSGTHYANCVSTDTSGNSYVSGYYKTGSISFGTYTLNNVTGNDASFLAKFDPAGNVLWLIGINGPGIVRSSYCGADGMNNVYVIGSFYGSSLTIGSNTLINSGASDIFLAKFNGSGAPLWAKSNIGSGSDMGYCLATYSTGVWISGSMGSIIGGGGSSVTVGSFTLAPPAGFYDPLFVAQYDQNGNVLFATPLASGGDDMAAISTGTDCSLFLSGDFYNVSPFVLGTNSLNLSGTESIFTAKLDFTCGGIPDYLSSAAIIDQALQLFPNPSSGQFTVNIPQLTDHANAFLYSSSGELLETFQLQQGDNSIDMNGYAKGLYFLCISKPDGMSGNIKLVKE